MASKAVKAPSHGDGWSLRGIDQRIAITSENSLDVLRAQYLAEIFALPPSTATLIAELAFGGEGGQ